MRQRASLPAAPTSAGLRRGSVVAAMLAAAALLAGCGDREEPPAQRPMTAPRTQAQTEKPDAPTVADHLRALQRIAREHGGTRAAGTPGARATADYIAGELRDAGYDVRFQRISFPFFDERSPPRLGDLRRRRDFMTARYSPRGEVEARVRATGNLGCTAGDFDAVRDGEIALVRRGTCPFRAKARTAARAGAAALLVVDPQRERPIAATLGGPGVDIPVLFLSSGAADRLAGDTVRLKVDTVAERRTGRNVIAEPRGAGTAAVMAGGHLDSVPEGPGLNDNGSGIAALLHAARRTEGVRYGFWAAEELGLHGSRRYVRSLGERERDRLRAYLNLDMVGTPGGKLREYGPDEVREALPPERRAGLRGGSDHVAFRRAGIPAGGLFTGLGRCYHRRCDSLDYVDEAMVRRTARAATRALRRLAKG